MSQTQCNLKGAQKLFFIQLGQAASCCRSYPVPLTDDVPTLLAHWKNESESLQQGIPITSCSSCWKDEAENRVSYRQKNGHKTNNGVEIWLNNSCNQMCSYCSPKFSSTWAQNIVDNGPFENISRTAKDNLVLPLMATDQSMWLEKVREYLQIQPPESVELKLLGGEPLMQLQSLRKLIALESNSIRQLTIVTNLNPPDNKFLRWVLDAVSNHKLKFNISLDATPKYNHVPRAGFDADRFESNLRLLVEKNIPFKLLSTVSILSVFDLPKFVQWSRPYQVIFNKIHNPDCLDPGLLPEHILKQIKDQFEQEPPMIFRELYEKPQFPIDLKLYEQYNYLCQYFSRTGIDPTQIDNSVFQQYWTWLEERQK
jgi:organic radical activating enzyme